MSSTAAEIPRRAVVRLIRFGFEEGERAAALLSDPALGLWDLERNEPADPEAGPVVAALARAGDPDLALRSLHRLVEALDRTDESGTEAATLLAHLRGSGLLRSRLLAVLGASSGLADHLAAHPRDWTVLEEDAEGIFRGSSGPSAKDLERRMLAAVGADPDDPPWGVRLGKGAPDASPERIAALRLAYRRAILSLAGRDLGEGLPAEEAASELADIAAAVLTAGLALAVAEQPASAAACRLAVIALGKTGGRELNYVSDVDVVFVAEPVDPSDPESAALSSATRVAAALMRICREAAWEVDAALRPEGKAGALVRTLAGHQAYYEQWASTWEFQALLKMRPVAGDPDLGRSYVDALWPMVWKAGDRPGFVGEVQAMRRRVEANIPPAQAERELKLGRGGLRDVEFAVQLLQMVHGRVDPSLRVGGTLPALMALSAGGYVGREDAATLIASYRFLRTVEHRLQLLRLRRTHLLPTDDQQLRWLARSLGYKPDHRGQATDVLQAELALHTREVRRLHEKLFYRPLLSAVARVPGEQLQLGSQGGGGLAARAGVRRPRGGAAPPRCAHRRGVPLGLDAEVPAARAAPDLRVLPQSRRGAAGLPAGQRGPRRQPVVPPPAARRGPGGRAAGAAARVQPVHRLAADPHARGAAAAGRRRPARAPDARRRWRTRGGRRPAGRRTRRKASGCCAGCAARSCCAWRRRTCSAGSTSSRWGRRSPTSPWPRCRSGSTSRCAPTRSRRASTSPTSRWTSR